MKKSKFVFGAAAAIAAITLTQKMDSIQHQVDSSQQVITLPELDIKQETSTPVVNQNNHTQPLSCKEQK